MSDSPEFYAATGAARWVAVRVHPSIISSYDETPLYKLAMGIAAPDVADDLLRLTLKFPWQRISDLSRDIAVQAKRRQQYEASLAKGLAKGQRSPYVAIPGKSMHNAKRAIDSWIDRMLANLGAEYLDRYWPIAAQFGFTPVISAPKEGVSESWHFDHFGPWRIAKDRLGYEQAVLAANCAMGTAGSWQNDQRKIQAHLHRLGQNIGEIDGNLGPRSRGAIQLLGFSKATAEATKSLTTRAEAMAEIIQKLESL